MDLFGVFALILNLNYTKLFNSYYRLGQLIKYHSRSAKVSKSSNSTKARVFDRGFLITRGARPLNASPVLNRILTCRRMLLAATSLLVRT